MKGNEKIHKTLERSHFAVLAAIWAPAVLLEKPRQVAQWGGKTVADHLKRMGFMRIPYVPADSPPTSSQELIAEVTMPPVPERSLSEKARFGPSEKLKPQISTRSRARVEPVRD